MTGYCIMALPTTFARSMLLRPPVRVRWALPLSIKDSYFAYKIDYKARYEESLLKWSKLPRFRIN